MASSTSVSNSLLTETDYYSLLIDYAVKNKFSIALWRLPNDPVIRMVMSRKPKVLKYTATLEDLPPGFIFAPFDASADRIFLQAELTLSFSEGRLNEPMTPVEVSSNAWLGDVINHQNKKAGQSRIYIREAKQITTTPKDLFFDLVADAVTEIEKGIFEKVVLSRTKVIEPGEDLDYSLAFKRLCQLYTNALISFISIPEAGSWLGASPELLVSVEGKRIFKTTALAGTQAYSEGVNLKAVAWTQKDIQEQALVERYIISCFKKIRLREYEEHGPMTVVAGNLIHLKSDFTVDMQATNFPQLGSVMLQLLHPTSAVCGVPLDTSLEFIHKREGYDRQFYTGYLGPVNFLDRIDIYVNLRCLQLLRKSVTLYSGAGITQDSVPEKEWEETDLKLNTLLNVIE